MQPFNEGVEKPVYLVFDEGVREDEKAAVRHAIVRILRVVGLTSRIQVRDFGVWRQPDYFAGQALQAYASVDWYVAMGHYHGRTNGQMDAGRILEYMLKEPWQAQKPHYEVMVLSDDMFCGTADNFVIGIGQQRFGTVLSSYRFRELPNPWRTECLAMIVMHELGHVFGLLQADRQRTEEKLGRHCANRCIMRQGLSVQEWITMARELRTGNLFCHLCEDGLRQYFFQSPERK